MRLRCRPDPFHRDGTRLAIRALEFVAALAEATLVAADQAIDPPSPLWLALEGRAWLEYAALLPAMPFLRRAPGGDGHPVLVLPGWLASDLSTRALRRFLRQRGYYAHGWRLGLNLGPSEETRSGLAQTVDRAQRASRAYRQRDRLESRRHLRARAGAPLPRHRPPGDHARESVRRSFGDHRHASLSFDHAAAGR